MDGPDYTTYTLDQLREAFRSIDAAAYPSRAESLELLIRDRETREVSREGSIANEEPTTQDDSTRSQPTTRMSTRRVTGIVIVCFGVWGILSSAGMMLSAAVFGQEEAREFSASLEALDMPNLMGSLDGLFDWLWLRAALAVLASCAYLASGILVLKHSRFSTRAVFVAVVLTLAKYTVESIISVQAGGIYAILALQNVFFCAVHVAVALIIYFSDPSRAQVDGAPAV